jgi:[ribosomal protein S5]-alanine N-acetyltransferase
MGSLLDADVPKGWPPGEYDEAAQRFFLDRLSVGGAEVVGWYGWYALLRRSSGQTLLLIASGGFLGLPTDSGVVEIGYSVLPDWRGQGYATEMVGELVKYAFGDRRVNRIVAPTTRQNPGSCKVLEHLGFNESGFGPDPLTIEFELHSRKPGPDWQRTQLFIQTLSNFSGHSLRLHYRFSGTEKRKKMTYSIDTDRGIIRHAVATMVYRGAKTLRDVPPGFGVFRIKPGSRTPVEILAHMGDLFDWSLSMAKGQEVWHESAPL